MVYHVLVRLRPCVLFSGCEVLWDFPGVPFRSVSSTFKHNVFGSKRSVRDPYYRLVFPTTMTRSEVYQNILSSDDPTRSIDHALCQHFKALIPMPWMELGAGTLLGGGESYGNRDCEAGWWYRRAYLVAMEGPTLWERRRGLFHVCFYGSEAMQRLFGVMDVLREIASFL